MELTTNAADRRVPKELDGRKLRPYQGKLAEPIYSTLQKKLRMWRGESKVTSSLEEAVRKSGLKDGMTVSFHHCLRNGDEVINMVVGALAGMGFRDLRLAQTAVFKKQ